MGCAQLEQLDDYIAAKRRIAERYTDALSEVAGITPMREAPWAASIFWLYTVLVDEQQYGMDSRALLRKLTAHHIQARPLWQPIHRSPAHAAWRNGECPVSEHLYRTSLSLPCSVGLTSDAQDKVIQLLCKS